MDLTLNDQPEEKFSERARKGMNTPFYKLDHSRYRDVI